MTTEEIITQVAAAYGVRREAVLGPTKGRAAMLARRELYARLLCEPWRGGYRSLTQVGRIVGGRHHATVLYGLRQYAEEVLGLDARASVAEIRQAVQAGEMGRAA
jgi:chromosomal replication initiation ATPase DnaA